MSTYYCGDNKRLRRGLNAFVMIQTAAERLVPARHELFYEFAAIYDVDAAWQLWETGVAGISTAVHVVDAGEPLTGGGVDARGIADEAVYVSVVAAVPFVHALYLGRQFVAQPDERITWHLNFAVPQSRLTWPSASVSGISQESRAWKPLSVCSGRCT